MKRKGFSITEVIVSMILCVIISISALSTIISMISANNKIKLETHAIHNVSNVLECFKSNNFSSGLNLLFDTNVSLVDNVFIIYFDANGNIQQPLNAKWFISGEIIAKTLNISAKTIDDKVIYETSYTKA